MGEIRLSLAAQNVGQWRDLARKLRQAGRTDLRKQLRDRISEAGKPVVDEVKAAIENLNVTSARGGGGMQRAKFKASKARTEKARDRLLRAGRGLRREVAAATRLQITTQGIRIITASNRMPPDQQTLPRHLDSATGWRHPVFGDRENWVSQKGGPWFASTIQKRAPAFRDAVVRAMNDIQQEIES